MWAAPDAYRVERSIILLNIKGNAGLEARHSFFPLSFNTGTDSTSSYLKHAQFDR